MAQIKIMGDFLKYNKQEKGFTFLEFLIVVFVITVGLGGVFALVPVSIYQTGYSNSRLTAIYLAQEGMEIVKNIRDQNLINSAPDPWTGLTVGANYASYSDVALMSCGGSCPPLRRNASGFYNYTSGETTNFKRTINVSNFTDSGGGECLKISSVVEWTDGKGTHAITAEENLYDYY